MGEHGEARGADHGAAPEERFEDLVGALLGLPGVTPPRSGRGFGRSALRVDDKIFAMLVRGRLVLKLPRRRVDTLIAAGEGIRFDANKGIPMKEWLSLDPASPLPWHPLAQEALEFVRGTVLTGRPASRLARPANRVAPPGPAGRGGQWPGPSAWLVNLIGRFCTSGR